MTKRSPFKNFKTSPEIIRLAVIRDDPAATVAESCTAVLTVELQGDFRAVDGYFAANQTSFIH